MRPFQVPEGPYTIEKIMESIRTQVIERPATPLSNTNTNPTADGPGAGAESSRGSLRPLISDGCATSQLLASLELMRQRQELDPGYQIKSHRPVIGAALNFIKRIIHWGARPYADAIRTRQEAFNEAAMQALREVSLQLETPFTQQHELIEANQHLRESHQSLSESHQKVSLQQETLFTQQHELIEANQHLRESHQDLSESHQKVSLQQETLFTQQHELIEAHQHLRESHQSLSESHQKVSLQLETLFTQHHELIEAHQHLSESHQSLRESFHILTQRCKYLTDEQLIAGDFFEILRARHDLGPFFKSVPPAKRLAALNRTRGSYDEIEARQQGYVHLLKDAPGPVLDVGCGRGELLNLLRRQGMDCLGAEVDPLMVEEVSKQGIHVIQTDAQSALHATPPASLGGIFAAQVVEHFFPGELLNFLLLAREKLAPGGHIILETINPASPGAMAKSFYRDLDHKQPIHPEYMKLLLEMAGFEQVELGYLAPFNDDERLPDLPPAGDLGLSEAARDAFQARLDQLNRFFFGMQDYYVAARQGQPAQPATPQNAEDAAQL